MYRLVCAHPDVSPLQQAYLAMRAAPDSERQARIDALFLRWATLLREAPDAPPGTHVTGRNRAHHGFSHAERAQQLYQSVLGRLLPLDTWFGEPVAADDDTPCPWSLLLVGCLPLGAMNA